jgi:Phage derived protein Gp49-like (DUF891)
MKRSQIEFFEDEGRQPVREWLDSDDVPEDVKGRVLARIDLLAQHGPTLDFPYTSQIEGKLRELRFRFGKTRIEFCTFLTTGAPACCSTDLRRTLTRLQSRTKRLDDHA